ncbi:MAG: protein translocase subunit SecD [Acidimicrobiales bacterium]
MKKNQMLVSVIAVLLLCFGAFVGVLAAGKSPILGLDLRGGDDYLYCPTNPHTGKCAANGTVSSTKLNEVVQILQDRVGALGVAQPNISVQGGDIDVQVPGHVNDQQLEKIIGQTSNLYFRKVLCVVEPWVAPSKTKSTTTTTTTTSTTTTQPAKVTSTTSRSTTTDPSTTVTTKAATTTSTKAATTTTTTAPATTTTTTTTQPSKYYAGYVPPPACPAADSTQTAIADGDFFSIPDTYQSKTQGVNTSVQDLANPTQNMVLPYVPSGATSGSVVERLEVGPVQADASVLSGASSQVGSSGAVVQFSFNGGQGLASWNKNVAGPDYQGYIADDLSGQIVTFAENQAQTYTSTGGQITGLDSTQVSQVTLLLQYGALPVNIQSIDQTSVSPTLGAASLHAGVLAGLVGLLLVMGYTIWYYRALGLVVVIGLTSTAALLYAIISAAKLTLDLSGVTGLIVSIGITVDSYIVYFERLKDEVRAGRSIRSSVDKGFKSAFRTIVSADLVSLIGAIVLYFLSIGDVKNFAFMLGISTILDLGSAFFFTRPLVILLGRNRVFTEARGLGIARGLAAATGGEAGA